MYRYYYRIFVCQLILAALLTQPGAAQKIIRLVAPGKALHFSFQIIKGRAFYTVAYKGKPLIRHSPLGLSFNHHLFDHQLQNRAPVYAAGVERYQLIAGKKKDVQEPFSEVVIPLMQQGNPANAVNFHVRAFNGGIAFRYEFLKRDSTSMLVLNDEQTCFNVTGDPVIRTLFLPGFTSSHEGLYTTLPFSRLPEQQLMDMPGLIEFPSPVFMAITEASLVDYAGMYLVKRNGMLQSALSPWPADSTLKVKAGLPHHSPWRVLLISDRIGDLIESNIITALNEPCRIQDLSWLKPGKTTFPWWNGNVVPDTLNAPGNNFITQQYYIDFCARNGIAYHSVVEYGLHQWYRDDGAGFMPGPNADVTSPVPGLDMQAVCDYAKQKGVGIRVWAHWAALYAKLDSALAIFEKWGISGMMVDFMDRDDQQMVNMQIEMLQKAAAHHIHIQFHGAYKPTGVNRTYPNELTREGTLNYENNKWNRQGISPDHDLDIVFTRMLAGSTDYHMGGFRAVTPDKYRAQYTRPLMLGTRAHMLGMYVVLENYLGMVCDYPEAYEGERGFDFVQTVPTTWDDTKVLAGAVGKFVVIARRKGNQWFVGGINNHEARTLTIPFTFLEGRYRVTIYHDGPEDATNPNAVEIEQREVTGKDSCVVLLSPGGGVAISMMPLPR